MKLTDRQKKNYHEILDELLKIFECEIVEDGVDDLILERTTTNDFEEETNIKIKAEITHPIDGSINVEEITCSKSVFGQSGELIDRTIKEL